MIDRITTEAVRRILAMRLAARYGRYNSIQKEVARRYAECAFKHVLYKVNTAPVTCDSMSILLDEDHWFLMRASTKQFWEEE